MAHELEIKKDGSASMFYAGQAPWHGLGVQVEKELTAFSALRMAQLDWTVEKRKVFFSAGKAMQEIEDKKAIVRLEDEKILGVVTNAYEPIQNKDAFEFLDGLVGEGLAMFHTAGSLFGGKRIFISCKLPNSFKIGPDKIDKYLVAMTSHDGSTAFHIKWTPIRVVCNNTLSAAFKMNNGKVSAVSDAVSVYHTKNYKDNMTQARQVLDLTNGYYDRIEECFNKLIEAPMDSKDFQKFTKRLMPKPQESAEKDAAAFKANITMWENRQAELLKTFETGIGLKVKGVAGTKWAAYNAVTEYVDHHKNYTGRKNTAEESRMNSIVWGYGAETKKEALALLA